MKNNTTCNFSITKLLTLVLVIGGLFASTQTIKAAAITVGDAAIDRTVGDSFSYFSMALLTETVPVPGLIAGWETYIERIDGPDNIMALMFLEPVSGDDYRAVFVDQQNVSVGLNSFVVAPNMPGAVCSRLAPPLEPAVKRTTGLPSTWSSTHNG